MVGCQLVWEFDGDAALQILKIVSSFGTGSSFGTHWGLWHQTQTTVEIYPILFLKDQLLQLQQHMSVVSPFHQINDLECGRVVLNLCEHLPIKLSSTKPKKEKIMLYCSPNSALN
jgi:hypothetical protein